MTLKSKAQRTPLAAAMLADAPAAQPQETKLIVRSVFDALPDCAFVRESQLVRSPKRPNVPVPLPFSAPTLWRKVAASTFPTPVKMSAGITAWRVADVRQWMAEQAAKGAK